MTIRDDDLQAYAAQARDLWLDSLPADIPDHNFSRRFRRKILLSRFRAYRLVYFPPIRRFFSWLAFFLVLNLLALPFVLREIDQSSLAFLQEADRLVIRYAKDFAPIPAEDLTDSLLLPQTIPLPKDYSEVAVEDLSGLFGPNGPTTLHWGSTDEERIFRLRLAVVFEMDFYREDELLGTIKALTPRDVTALQEIRSDKDNAFAFWNCGGWPVCLRRGASTFQFYPKEILAENLNAILTAAREEEHR